MLRDTDIDLGTRQLRFGPGGATTTTTVDPPGLDLTFSSIISGPYLSNVATQTFTASQTGILQQVELGLQSNGSGPVPLVLTLRQGSSPSGTVLGSGGGNSPGGPFGTNAAVAVGLNVPVVQGQVYLLQLAAATNTSAVRWGYLGNYYPGGQASQGPGNDCSFRTTIAPPGASLLVGANGVGVGTDAPDRPLTVRGSGSFSQLLSLQDAGGSTQWHYNLQGGGLNLAESGVADHRLFVQNGGNVGLGTSSPQSRLDVNGDLTVQGQLQCQQLGQRCFQLGPTGGVTFTWNHNLGYRPVLMLSVQNNDPQFSATAEYIQATYSAIDQNSLEITLRNTNPNVFSANAVACVHWLVVGR